MSDYQHQPDRLSSPWLDMQKLMRWHEPRDTRLFSIPGAPDYHGCRNFSTPNRRGLWRVDISLKPVACAAQQRREQPPPCIFRENISALDISVGRVRSTYWRQGRWHNSQYGLPLCHRLVSACYGVIVLIFRREATLLIF